MTEGYAERMAKYASPKKTLPVDSPVSQKVMDRTQMTPAQRAQFYNLQDIFSRREIGSDPIAQVGALNTRQGDIQPYPYPTTVYGVTFNENLLPSSLAAKGRTVQDMIARSGYNIGNLKNKMVIGPEVTAGEITSNIPHELGHRGMNALNRQLLGEQMMRAISVSRGEDVTENLRFMNQKYPRADGAGWTPQNIRETYGEFIDQLQHEAASYLRQRGLK